MKSIKNKIKINIIYLILYNTHSIENYKYIVINSINIEDTREPWFT